jgi:tetratricopeptide (TPR) repeat protein
VTKDDRLGVREPREYRRSQTTVANIEELPAVAGLNGMVDRQQLLAGSLGISAWAEAAGKPLPALRFAEAAAACDPFDPAAANTAARLARTLGMGARADVWYSRGIGLARARRWSACYIRAHIGFATLHKEVGNVRRALALYSRGAWHAQRTGIKWLAAEVHHDMLLLALSQRAFVDAESYAARALTSYPRHHDRIPALVHDIGLLCTRELVFELAFPLLRRAVPLMSKPHEKLIVWSTLALAAAGSDERDAYVESCGSALDLVPTYPGSAPPALMNLAFAAHVRREWAAAAAYARKALEIAAANPLFQEQTRDAERLLGQVQHRVPAPLASELPVRSDGSDAAEALRALFEPCMRLAARWHGRTWRQRREQAKPGEFGQA